MCGAYNVINSPFTDKLANQLGIDEPIETRGIRVPASSIQIINESSEGTRQLVDAKWWLLLKNIDGELKADYKWKTFNSKSARLRESRLTKKPYRESRCIIPATGFIEGQDKKYHYLQPEGQAIAFGGLFKEWYVNDEVHYSASIITLGGNPKLEDIHQKSLPLMLPLDQPDTLNAWLDRSFTEIDAFNDLLEPTLRTTVEVTKLHGARDLRPAEPPFIIDAD